MNTIESCLHQVEKVNQIITKFNDFKETKRGKEFVKLLHRDHLKVLCNKYCKWLYFTKNETKIYNIINYCMGMGYGPDNIHRQIYMYSEKSKPVLFTNTYKKYPIYCKINKDNVIKKLTRTQLLHGYELHKIQKWEKLNPCPIKKSDIKDLFEDHFMKEWNEKRDFAIERIRNIIVSCYAKLPVYARYEIKEGNYSDYFDNKIAEIKDKSGEGHSVSSIPENSRLLTKIRAMANNEKRKNPKLVALLVQDYTHRRGRIVSPSIPYTKLAA